MEGETPDPDINDIRARGPQDKIEALRLEIYEKVNALGIGAAAIGLPLIVHSRDADEDTVALLREGADKGGLKGVIHCFTATQYLADAALEKFGGDSVQETRRNAESYLDTLRYK